jgi:hypothetical protein
MDTIKGLALEVCSILAVLVQDTRKTLATAGRKLDDIRLAMPKVAKNPSDPKSELREASREECIEHIGTLLLVEGKAFNSTLAKKAFVMLDDAREATKRGVYEAWTRAETDVAADALVGKLHTKKVPDTFLVKLAKLLEKAKPEELEKAEQIFRAQKAKVQAMMAK